MINEKWLTDLSIAELQQKATQFTKPYKPYEINGEILYKNRNIKLLEDEIFKYYSDLPIEVSNYGRIKYKDEIIEQKPDLAKNEPEGYLWIEIPNVTKYKLVYRLVAETWCYRPDRIYDTVHHISNNGTDNRSINLLWVTKEQHAEIHPFLKNFIKKGQNSNELSPETKKVSDAIFDEIIEQALKALDENDSSKIDNFKKIG